MSEPTRFDRIGKIANLTVTRGDLSIATAALLTSLLTAVQLIFDRPPAGQRGATVERHLDTSTSTSARAKSDYFEPAAGRRATSGSIQVHWVRARSRMLRRWAGEVRFSAPVNIEGQTKEATFVGTARDKRSAARSRSSARARDVHRHPSSQPNSERNCYVKHRSYEKLDGLLFSHHNAFSSIIG